MSKRNYLRVPAARDSVSGEPLFRSHALRQLGPVVYALRLDGGLIKIGFTTDLEDRERTVRRQAASESSELLAVMLGASYEDEQAIHERLRDHVAKGREYYHPTPAVLDVVNDMRAALHLPLVAA